ncbi:MAG TPA: hypothetical protein ENK60_02240 [Anaerolineae bacterium]|nr:hypothetical protein [Anaerolineae bacterium]
MSILTPSPFRPKRSLARWRPRGLVQRGPRGHLARPLALVGGAAALTIGAAVATLVVGGLMVVGLGALIGGGLILSGYWFKTKRSGIWLHLLVDSEDVVISLAFPLPLTLFRWGLRRAPIDDNVADLARMILEDPELMNTLRHDAIEIQVDDGSDHIEVVIGPRRKHWRAFQFHPLRSITRNHSSHLLEENNHVG